MVEGVSVKFRWFRTVETAARTVVLASSVQEWDSIELVWNDVKLLFESGPLYMRCGRHSSTLVIDGIQFPCCTFTIVPTSIEVNIYLQNDQVTSSEYNGRIFEVGSRMSENVYEELLAVKDREITDLRDQLGQMKSYLMTYENTAPRSSCEIGRCNEENDETDCEVLDGVEKATESLDVAELVNEVQVLRRELCECREKNRELGDEVVRLRSKCRDSGEESLSVRPSNRLVKSTESIYFSDPESSSTQYRDLPSLRAFQSLPTGLPSFAKRFSSPPPHQKQSLSPPNSDSLKTDELINYGISLYNSTVAVQTEITALFGVPSRYSKNSVRRSLFGCDDVDSDSPKFCFREGVAKNKRSAMTTAGSESDDTEDLLKEADGFVTTILGKNGLRPLRHRLRGGGEFLKTGSSGYISQSFVSVNSVSEEEEQASKQPRPFLLKSVSQLRIGHKVRYFGSSGIVTQGVVTYLGPLTGQHGTFVGLEADTLANCSFASSSYNNTSSRSCTTFVPFKKVIMAWEQR